MEPASFRSPALADRFFSTTWLFNRHFKFKMQIYIEREWFLHVLLPLLLHLSKLSHYLFNCLSQEPWPPLPLILYTKNMSKHCMSKYPQSYLKFSRASPSPQIPALSFLHQSDLLRTSIISHLHRIRVGWLSNGTDSNLNFKLICELNFKGRHYHFVQNGVTICEQFLLNCVLCTVPSSLLSSQSVPFFLILASSYSCFPHWLSLT